MTPGVAFAIAARDGAARTGALTLSRGAIRTPVFMPVGTAGTVKAMTMDDVRATGTDVILGNTYHLMLRPGAERVAALGGLHAFSGWSGPILTRLPAPDPAFGPPTVTLPNGRTVSNPLATPIRFAYPTRGDGQFSLGALQIWSLRIGRTFTMRHGRLETAADVFNLTNHDADQALQIGGNQQYNPFFGTGMTRQFPRALQLSARFLF